jgi:H+/gluconate symporter-like permease
MQERYEETGRRVATRRAEPPAEEARRSAAALPLGLGGLVTIIGTWLSWASQRGNENMHGSSFADGRLVMAIGFAMVIMALYMGTSRRFGRWYDSDLLGVVLSTIAIVMIVATWAAFPDGRDADTGLYVSLGGAVIAFVGSLVALMQSHRDVRATPYSLDGTTRGDVAA